MARKLVVEIIGDASSLEKSYRRAARGTKVFGNEIERAGRGATVATIGYHGLGRAVGTASAAFLGGAGLTYAIKSTISAAEESQRVLGQVQVAVTRSGLSWSQYKTRIQEAALATSRLSGFDDERLLQTFSTLVRRTGDVNRALELNALAADVARGRNIELEQASQLVLKASLGQAGALRRVGIAAKQGASGYQLIDMLQRKYAGSAAAYGKTAVGAQERFRNAIQNTQEAIGTALLPSITKLLDKTATWLDDTKNQEKLQRGLNTTVRVGAGVFQDLATAIGATADAYKRWRDLTGAGGTGGGRDKDPASFFKRLVGGNVIEQLQAAAADMQHLNDIFAGTPKVANDARVAVGAFVHDAATGLGVFGANRSPLLGPQPDPYAASQPKDPFADARPAPGTAATNAADLAKARARARARAARLAELSRTIFDQAIGRDITRAGYIPSLKGQITRYRQIISLIQQRINVTKDVTRRLNLEDQVLALQDTIRGIQAQRQANADAKQKQDDADAKKRAEAAKKRAREAAKRAKEIALANVKLATERVAAINKAAVAQVAAAKKLSDRTRQQQVAREQAAVFALLGLSPTGDTRTPSQGNLQAALKKAQAAIAGTPVDTKAMEARLNKLRSVINTEFGKLTRDTKLKVKEWLDALTGKDQDRLTGPSEVGGRKLVAALTHGLGLTPGQLSGLSSQIGRMDLTTTSPIVVHTHVNLDGAEVARNTTRHQARDRYRTARQTSGFRG